MSILEDTKRSKAAAVELSLHKQYTADVDTPAAKLEDVGFPAPKLEADANGEAELQYLALALASLSAHTWTVCEKPDTRATDAAPCATTSSNNNKSSNSSNSETEVTPSEASPKREHVSHPNSDNVSHRSSSSRKRTRNSESSVHCDEPRPTKARVRVKSESAVAPPLATQPHAAHAADATTTSSSRATESHPIVKASQRPHVHDPTTHADHDPSTPFTNSHGSTPNPTSSMRPSQVTHAAASAHAAQKLAQNIVSSSDLVANTGSNLSHFQASRPPPLSDVYQHQQSFPQRLKPADPRRLSPPSQHTPTAIPARSDQTHRGTQALEDSPKSMASLPADAHTLRRGSLGGDGKGNSDATRKFDREVPFWPYRMCCEEGFCMLRECSRVFTLYMGARIPA